MINLTNNMSDDVRPTFTSNGDKIVFESWRDGNCEIYIMNSDGSQQINLTENPGWDYLPAIQP